MTDIAIRLFEVGDGVRLMDIAQRCLYEVINRDYPSQIIEKMCSHFTAEWFVEVSRSWEVYVAETDCQVVGTVSRDGNNVYALFVDPDMVGRGIGRRLMLHIERLAARDGYEYIERYANIPSHSFYLKLGFTDIGESETRFGFAYVMRKPLS
ncbi:GNAT family N-acetyltransferase [Streptomyces roseochromogenus]|uniref:N-acetyltransferase domain-containing protein n=1 Tax=Streptomyces roseochromogenus subsp. oscitans DS 12.976 TaxID=1352936 RepID=V6K5I6_STRRC|nr:GNAT family N-acetyltransferase [Streptomyces roseochromogenus]EST27313.1 hypothetical protein M878_25275 [Streptomyces roseochromogenus subsp. oscitans DS 12.976]